MTTHTTTTNLMFLLAAAPLGMGCIIVTDDGDDTVGESGNQTSNGDTTAADTGTDTAPVTGSGSGSGGSGGSGDSTRGEESTAAVDSTGGGSGACADYGALVTECLPEYAEGAEYYCTQSLDYYQGVSAECGMAYEDYIACLSALSCEEFGGDAPCPDALAAFMAACPTGE